MRTEVSIVIAIIFSVQGLCVGRARSTSSESRLFHNVNGTLRYITGITARRSPRFPFGKVSTATVGVVVPSLAVLNGVRGDETRETEREATDGSVLPSAMDFSLFDTIDPALFREVFILDTAVTGDCERACGIGVDGDTDISTLVHGETAHDSVNLADDCSNSIALPSDIATLCSTVDGHSPMERAGSRRSELVEATLTPHSACSGLVHNDALTEDFAEHHTHDGESRVKACGIVLGYGNAVLLLGCRVKQNDVHAVTLLEGSDGIFAVIVHLTAVERDGRFVDWTVCSSVVGCLTCILENVCHCLFLLSFR